MNKSSAELTHKTGTRKEWLAARLKLLKGEKEHTRRGDEQAQKRQELPWVRVDNEYRFETEEATASLPVRTGTGCAMGHVAVARSRSQGAQ